MALVDRLERIITHQLRHTTLPAIQREAIALAADTLRAVHTEVHAGSAASHGYVIRKALRSVNMPGARDVLDP